MKSRCALAAFIAAAALALTACNGSTATAPPAIANISGDYTGSVQDSQSGSENVTGTLAQNGSSAGGSITSTPAGSLYAHFAYTVSPNNSMSGAIVIDETSGTTCTFSTSATYDPSTNVITGNYTAVTNCSGETGSYSLTQQCTDTVTNPSARRLFGVPKC